MLSPDAAQARRSRFTLKIEVLAGSEKAKEIGRDDLRMKDIKIFRIMALVLMLALFVRAAAKDLMLRIYAGFAGS